MNSIYFSDMREQGMGICTRSLFLGEQFFSSWSELIAFMKLEGQPYQLIDVDMLGSIPEVIAHV